MSKTRKISIALAGLAFLAGCESLPTVPNIFSGGSSTACPALNAGEGPFTPPFPVACDEMRTAASGLRWIALTEGDASKGSPGPDATVVVSYEGFLASSGEKIDSSYARGEAGVFQIAEIIDGWGLALQQMSPGDEWLVHIPAALAYGSEARGEHIPANSDLVFRMKLDGFLSSADLAAAAAGPAPEPQPAEVAGPVEALGPDMAAWQAFLPWDAGKPGVNQLDSGVSYIVLERGKSTTRNAVRSDDVVIHYEGRVAETSEFFDSSWSRGEPATFPVGGLIPGFTEALTYMRPGDRILVHIPADQAYGDAGSGDAIAPNTDIMFQINLLAIKPAG